MRPSTPLRLASSFVPGLEQFTLAAVFVSSIAGCGGPVPGGDEATSATESTGVTQSALGEPTADRPGYSERVAHYAGNRSRVDPALIGWQEFPAVPPLLWNDLLAQSGRAHSEDMRDTPCFMHPSCDGTPPDKRILSYYTQTYATLGENISAGEDDGQAVIHDWIEETFAPPGETGHRENMFSKDFHYVGLGYAAGGTQYHGYWTQDFIGLRKAPVIPPLSSGAHWPEQPAAGSAATFGTIYYDATGTAPDRVEVMVDGQAFALAKFAGAADKGAYQGTVTIASGCHRYYFRAVVGTTVSIYPDGGTLGVASDGTGECATYQAGGVSTDLNPPQAKGCDVGRAAGRGNAWVVLLGLLPALALARRRRSAR